MFDPETEAKLQRTIPIRPPPLPCYMPNPRPIAAIVPVPGKPESEYDSNDDIPVLADFVSNLSELPDLEDFENEIIEISIDDDLSELEAFVSDTEEIPPLEEVHFGSYVPSNEPIRRETSQYVLERQSEEFDYFFDPDMPALEPFE